MITDRFIGKADVLKIKPYGIDEIELTVVTDSEIGFSGTSSQFALTPAQLIGRGVSKGPAVLRAAGLISRDPVWGKLVGGAERMQGRKDFADIRTQVQRSLELAFELRLLCDVLDPTFGYRKNMVIVELSMKPSVDYKDAVEVRITFEEQRLIEETGRGALVGGEWSDPYEYY